MLAGPPCHTNTSGTERPVNVPGGVHGTARRQYLQRQHGNGRDTRQREGESVLPRSGDVLCVTRSASAQFTEPIMFRVIRVHDWQTADGWAWLDGYQLDSTGDAVERRSIFVQLTGLRSPGVARR